MTAALVTTPTAANAATVTVTVTDLTPPLAPVSLSQLDVGQVTLTFAVDSGTDQARPPKVIDATSSVPFADERASLVSGNLTTGTWEATVVLASFMDGSHAPRVRVCVTDTSCATHPLDTSIVVQGSDQPVLTSVSQNPDRLRAGKVSGAEAVGRVVFADSRDPVRAIAVRLVRQSGDTGRLVDRSNSRGRSPLRGHGRVPVKTPRRSP